MCIRSSMRTVGLVMTCVLVTTDCVKVPDGSPHAAARTDSSSAVQLPGIPDAVGLERNPLAASGVIGLDTLVLARQYFFVTFKPEATPAQFRALLKKYGARVAGGDREMNEYLLHTRDAGRTVDQ